MDVSKEHVISFFEVNHHMFHPFSVGTSLKIRDLFGKNVFQDVYFYMSITFPKHALSMWHSSTRITYCINLFILISKFDVQGPGFKLCTLFLPEI